MKLALTGGSSTGKTTLAMRLIRDPEIVAVVGDFVTEDARSLLRSLGHRNMDRMSRTEQREFQLLYLMQKESHEAGLSRFLVDRSYVDVAAYWLVRDSFDLPSDLQALVETRCRELAAGYDLHVHFPFGQIPFQSDGYRSDDLAFHEKIASKIEELLHDWDLRHVAIASDDFEARLGQVRTTVLDLPSKDSVGHK